MAPLALYIHWPFCLAKCPYCDFNSHVRERIPDARFRAALLTELAWERERLGARRLASIFFGGGTPSLMDASSVSRLIEAATEFFRPLADIEVTLEANPTSVVEENLAGFRDAGVNRLSLGVQSFDERALSFLGRRHTVTEARRALGAARRIFPRVSFDLIYARPGQTVAGWRHELAEAFALDPDHLSLYQLTIEPGTAFATRADRGELVLPRPEIQAALYEATAEEAARHGLFAYEVSNYARPGAECRHNLAYWRYCDYAGIGAGAHGRVTIGSELYATRRHRVPEAWAARVERAGHGTVTEEALAPETRAREMLLMGLRLAEGIEPARFMMRTGIELGSALDTEMLEECVAAGYLAWSKERLAVTSAGRLRLDAILGALIR
ncbi:MAG: radical SAM family heme chaperone HemW [Acetobacteraceae bacterium]